MFHAQNPQTRTCRAATATEQAASACTKRTAAKKPTAGTRGSASAASSTTSKEASRRSTSRGITYGQRITKCVLLNFCLLDYLKKVWSKRLTHLTIPFDPPFSETHLFMGLQGTTYIQSNEGTQTANSFLNLHAAWACWCRVASKKAARGRRFSGTFTYQTHPEPSSLCH